MTGAAGGPPRRVNYYFGQLLGVDDFSVEQSYFRRKHATHERWLHGFGVVCGLAVTPAGSGVTVAPGLAIDGFGREIVVPEPHRMANPRQPVDDRGEPLGDPLDSPVVTISLEYGEHPEGGDPPPRIRESYRLAVTPGKIEPAPASALSQAALSGSRDEVLRALCEAIAGRSCRGADECVVLATVDCSGPEVTVEPCPRPLACPTELLVGLVLGLVERVQALERAP